MNKIKINFTVIFAFLVFTLVSCGGDNQKTTVESDTAMSDTSVITNTPATPATQVNTIVTTPQHMIIARHKVADYDKWIASYDQHDSVRLANGLHNYVIGRSVDDPNMILVAIKADDMDKAKAFAKSASLKQAMRKGGVIGTPMIDFQTTFFQDTAPLPNAIRSMLKMTVKDRDAWQKSFDEGKQERIDNGIVTRVIGTDPDDNKKIILVTAITDTAKANAYWASDALKKRREAGGVVGTPERFRFTVVKRY